MRRIRSVLLVAFMILIGGMSWGEGAQEGVARPPSAGEPEYSFVIVTHATAVPFFVPVRKGAEEAGALLNCEVVYTGPPDVNHQRQVEIIRTAIAQGADGIGATMPDPEAYEDVVQEAMEKGIPVIALNADDADSGRLAYIGQGNYEAGRSMGEQIIRLLPDGGHVMLGIHTAGAFNLEQRISGIRDVLDDHGGFTYDVVATTTDLVRATSLIGSYYQGHPQTKGFFGVEDISGSAIAQVIEREGLEGEVFGGGFDLVPDVMLAIQNGSMQFTIDQQPYLQGFQTVMQLYLLKKYQLTPTDVNTGVAPVTQENVDAVMELAEAGYR